MKKRLPISPPQILPQPHPSAGITIDPNLSSWEEWYTTEDVMKHLNMSRSSVYRLRRKRELPAYKLGNIIVFPKHLINSILTQKALLNFNPPPPKEPPNP